MAAATKQPPTAPPPVPSTRDQQVRHPHKGKASYTPSVINGGPLIKTLDLSCPARRNRKV